ncbi:conserved Plasmodium protein, unknown function [Plasmodium gallinaceum]|uniref:ER membrane protein complex subunit 8 n=1 Tax=Plasmodium gallinaceum TaxID=5849 RepID=A0A1J1GV71_PLAGA|nr:conserved Plasmodium protein, unknown function [Plasmodium gallinaceum]CRG96449.1 conserved Plasmodium protein, unknown function [Plasmodium gallinaceum]
MKDIEITIDNCAYAKIFMHALKNSYDDVCGILIGKYSEDEKKGKKCSITNSIPLFHTHILAPFLNLSFTMVENYYKNKEEKIIGYYHINADESKNNDIKNIKICELISDKLIKNYKNALICLVQISKINNNDDNCLNIYMKGDTFEWKNVDINISNENKEFLKKYISNNSYMDICDFDDHLNCINYDFMNPDLFKKV